MAALEICPQCEETTLASVLVTEDITVAGTTVSIPDVRLERCDRCGFQSHSGREAQLLGVLLDGVEPSVKELTSQLKSAGFHDMFLRSENSEAALTFGSREYVKDISRELSSFYLDHEAGHVLKGLSAQESGQVPVKIASGKRTVCLPKIGEGENGVVYDFVERKDAVIKIAKPREYSRDHVRSECAITEFYSGHRIPVPDIIESDPYGSWVVKKRLEGESLAKIYYGLGGPNSPKHVMVRGEVERFVERLLSLFEQYPESKTSISPNNIFVVDGEPCRCLLVDTGPAPAHDYSSFDFADYWERAIPEKIERYKSVGYI
jgi:YgiT-type zinc finger domain-containing protein